MSAEKKVKGVQFAAETAPLPAEVTYGSVPSSASDEEDYDDFDVAEASVASFHSFHLGGATKVNAANVWTSVRRTPSFHEHGQEYEKVPTQLVENVKLVVDPNLDPNDRGELFYSEDAVYDNKVAPEYALTVPSDIYQRIFDEVNDASSIPCGLYFCCHGSDGAHTGVSHDDYVDITIAWCSVAFVFFTMLILSAVVPTGDGI